MTTFNCDRPVTVHVLYQIKVQNREVWTNQEGKTGATIRHKSRNVYTLEINKCENSELVLSIDFRKIKSYTMRAKSWHEVCYDGQIVALRFGEDDENFDSFFSVLENVLKLHKKHVKAKNDRKFLEEVEMFELRRLKPVDKAKSEELPKNRKAAVKGPQQSLPVMPSQVKEERSRSECSNEDQEKKSKIKPKFKDTPKRATMPNRPLPEVPRSKPPAAPPPRNEKNAPPGRPAYENVTLPMDGQYISDTSDEEPVDSEGNDEEYTAGAEYGDDEENWDASQSRNMDSRPPTRFPVAGGDSRSGSTPQRGNRNPPARADPSPSNTRPSLVPRASPKRNSTGQWPRPPRNLPLSTVPEWRCEKCTMLNAATSITCEVCTWLRADAWSCSYCSAVNSNDVSQCSLCPAWRCGLCTFVNAGRRNDPATCSSCEQR